MTEDEYIEKIKSGVACDAYNKLIQITDYLIDDEKFNLINKLITFENSHLIANCFKDDKIAYALYEELKQKFK